MTVTRKNVLRPIIQTHPQKDLDYSVLVIVLLYIFIILGTLKCKADAADTIIGTLPSAIVYHCDVAIHRVS